MGTVISGRSTTACLLITNELAQPRLISRFEVSCPCVTIEPATMVVPAPGDAVASITFDSSEERDFHGDLAIRVDAFAEDALPLFATEVLVSVVPSAP